MNNRGIKEVNKMRWKEVLLIYRRGWTATLAGSNEATYLELPRAWEPLDRSNPWTGRSFRKLVREKDPTVYFLMETRLDKEGFENLYSNLPFQNKIFLNILMQVVG